MNQMKTELMNLNQQEAQKQLHFRYCLSHGKQRGYSPFTKNGSSTS